MNTIRALVASALCAAAVGCAPLDESSIDESVDEISSNPLGMALVQVRHDNRRCVSPLCGGFWVHRVGRSTTVCADGTSAAECYVASMDYSALGLTDAALSEIEAPGDMIYRGRVEAHTYGTFGNLGQFVVTAAYVPATAAAPTGITYNVSGNHNVCVRAPCPTIDAVRVNGWVTPTALIAVDFSRVTGVSRRDIQRATREIATDGRNVLVAGALSSSSDGRTLTASQFWFKLNDGVADDRFCTATDDCRRGLHTRPLASSADCYCALCPNSIINTTFQSAYESQYRRYCTAFARTCPVARCAQPPAVACVNHACVMGPGATY